MTLDVPSCLSIANHIRYWDGIHAQDAEDFIHDAVLEMMERARSNGGGLTDKEMWRAARYVRSRYRRAYGKSPLSLNAPIRGVEEPIELQETIADKAAVDLDAWVDARTRLEQLPFGIRLIARKLEKGDPLTRDQQARLVRFRQDGKPNPHRIYMVNRYRDRRSRGLCVRCGEKSDGFAHCPRCREIFRAFQKRYRRRKGQAWLQTMRAHWRKQGRCSRCGRVPKPGRKKCSLCLAKDKEHLRRWRERQTRVYRESSGSAG